MISISFELAWIPFVVLQSNFRALRAPKLCFFREHTMPRTSRAKYYTSRMLVPHLWYYLYTCSIHTHTHTQTHTFIHTLTHTHTQTHARAHTHTHTHTFTRYTRTHARTGTHAHTHTHTRSNKDTHANTQARTTIFAARHARNSTLNALRH